MGYDYGTIASTGTTMTLTVPSGAEPPRTPSGLIATRAVETKDGWLGQVIVDKEIVLETPLTRYSDTAIREANKRVVTAIKALFEVAPTVVESTEIATTGEDVDQ